MADTGLWAAAVSADADVAMSNGELLGRLTEAFAIDLHRDQDVRLAEEARAKAVRDSDSRNNDIRSERAWDDAQRKLWDLYDRARSAIDASIDVVDAVGEQQADSRLRSTLGYTWRAIPHPDTSPRLSMSRPEWLEYYRSEAVRLRGVAIEVERVAAGRP